MSTAAVVAPPVKKLPPQKAVSPEAVRVVFSPLVNLTVNTYRIIPFGTVANVPPSEYWASIRDIPKPAQIRVSPDPADPSTWPPLAPGQLPKPTLACALMPSDAVLERLLKDYGDLGAVELVSLRDASVGVLSELNAQLGLQLRTYAQTLEAVKQYRVNVLPSYAGVLAQALTVAIADIEQAASRALQIARQHWQRRKVEILRAANGDKEYTNHPDEFDLRMCEYAGIDPTQTEADALRADLLQQRLSETAAEPRGATTLSTEEIMQLATQAGAAAGSAAAVEVGKVMAHELAKTIKSGNSTGGAQKSKNQG
jgi:hypothetical protein